MNGEGCRERFYESLLSLQHTVVGFVNVCISISMLVLHPLGRIHHALTSATAASMASVTILEDLTLALSWNWQGIEASTRLSFRIC